MIVTDPINNCELSFSIAGDYPVWSQRTIDPCIDISQLGKDKDIAESQLSLTYLGTTTPLFTKYRVDKSMQEDGKRVSHLVCSWDESRVPSSLFENINHFEAKYKYSENTPVIANMNPKKSYVTFFFKDSTRRKFCNVMAHRWLELATNTRMYSDKIVDFHESLTSRGLQARNKMNSLQESISNSTIESHRRALNSRELEILENSNPAIDYEYSLEIFRPGVCHLNVPFNAIRTLLHDHVISEAIKSKIYQSIDPCVS